MSEENTKPRLGRGLAALIGDTDVATAAPERVRATRQMPLEFITNAQNNPRKHFDPAALAELTASIAAKGVLQPIVVRQIPQDPLYYEVVAGERRLRASREAGLQRIPVHIIEVSDGEMLELALLENLQREDLNAMEEAFGFQNLISQYGYSHQEIGRVFSKSRPYISNMLRLLTLPKSVQDLVASGEMSKSHARSIINAEDPESEAKRFLAGGMTVRDAENVTAETQLEKVGEAIQKLTARSKDPNIVDVERRLGSHLGLRVTIKAKGEGGELALKYASLEQLEAILRLLEK